MTVLLSEKADEEPSLSPGAAVAAKVSRGLLLAMGIGPIAVFPIGVAYKAIVYFFGLPE